MTCSIYGGRHVSFDDNNLSSFDDLHRGIGIFGVARGHCMGCKVVFFRFSGYFGGLVRDDWRTTRPQERTARRDEDARIAVYLTERGLMAKPGS